MSRARHDRARGKRDPFLRVVAESWPRVEACRDCGVVAGSHGRRDDRLVDAPCFGRPIELVRRNPLYRHRSPRVNSPNGPVCDKSDLLSWVITDTVSYGRPTIMNVSTGALSFWNGKT